MAGAAVAGAAVAGAAVAGAAVGGAARHNTCAVALPLQPGGVHHHDSELHDITITRPRATIGYEMPTRRAHATWEQGLQNGKGSFEGESKSIGGQFSFGSRFENGTGSNPEELLAAAEAACFSMALSAGLEKNGTPPERVDTNAACTIDRSGDGFRITRMALTVRARVSGIDSGKFQEIAQATKQGCPVSQALSGNVDITLDAQLEQ